MIVKLIKTEDGYNLVTEQPQGRLLEATCSPSQEKKLLKSGATAKKLSLKNCEAVKNGYDLDELAEIESNESLKICPEHSKSFSQDEIDRMRAIVKAQTYIGFKVGFQKALEILGDKKFSEEDMRIAYDAGASNIDGDGDPIDDVDMDFEGIIHSAQETEWDVEVVTLVDLGGTATDSTNPSAYLGTNTAIPKLDKNDCLILKRV